MFTSTPYLGNPVAVVLDGSDLTDSQMLAFAQWTNLSETTFVLPPSADAKSRGADYQVRIFTPGGELSFAGHPTLGTCFAWLEDGGKPQRNDCITQECKAGLIAIRRSKGDDGTLSQLAFKAPPVKLRNPSPVVLAQIAESLGLKASQLVTAQMLDNGAPWLALILESAQTVMALKPDHSRLKNQGFNVGVVHLAPEGQSPEMLVRAFGAPIGVIEDPVTGSLNAALAQWLGREGLVPEKYVVSQGEAIGRAGRVHIERSKDASGEEIVWVGGESITCIKGKVLL